MRHIADLLVLLIFSLVGACTSASKPVAQAAPKADELLVDAGLPNHFWREQVTSSGNTEDGSKLWLVSGTELPQRAEDSECVARDYTWTISINPKDGHGSLYSYSDDPTMHNPEVGFMLNDDIAKRSLPCDQIDLKDYFVVGEGIQPHRVMSLIQELHEAVECVKQGKAACGKWKKLELNVYKDDFIKLPTLRIFAIEWEDREQRDKLSIKYMLSPINPDRRPYLHAMDCLVRESPDGLLELDIAEGDYE
jgi:hypothetical protein